MRKIIIFLVVSFLVLNAETLDLGGKRLELVNGTITNRDAKIVFTKFNSLYKRGKYYDAKKLMDKFIGYYKGNRLPEAYFLRAKARYMNSSEDMQAYNDFLNLYDTYPDSKIVKSGKLKQTLKKIVDKRYKYLEKVLKKHKFSNDMDRTIKYIVLYDFIANTDKMKKKFEKFISTTGYTKTFTFDTKHYRLRFKEKCRWIKYTQIEGRLSFPDVYNLDLNSYNHCNHDDRLIILMDALSTAMFDQLSYLFGVNPSGNKLVFSECFISRLNAFPQFSKKNSIIKGYKDYKYGLNDFFTMKINNHEAIIIEENGYIIKVHSLYHENWRNGNVNNIYTNLKIEFSSLKKLIIAKHGSLYDWVGLKRVDDAL